MDTKSTKRKAGIVQRLLLKLRNYFTTGILVLAPTAVSIWILDKMFRWFDNILGKWYTELFRELSLDHAYTIRYIPGIGAFTLAIFIIIIGFFARQYAGRKFFDLWEKAINYIPLINRIYIAVRQLSDSVAKGGGIAFQYPVMVQYPRKGLFSIGFVTRRCEGTFCQLAGTAVSSVFIPTTPNPTSGLVVFVPQEDIIPIEMSVEDAMKLIISAGFVSPDIKLPIVRDNDESEDDSGNSI